MFPRCQSFLKAAACLAAAWPPVVQGQALLPDRAGDANAVLEQREPEQELPAESLADAIADAFGNNPELAAARYDLRATDDDIGVALSRYNPQFQFEVAGGYNATLPGALTQSRRPISDRLNDRNIEANDLTTQLSVDQPLFTGGRASSALGVAMASSAAGRASLRSNEGDLLVDLIAAYSDVLRDRQALAIRERNVRVFRATLDEISARRDAGELTRTDIAQAQTQLQAALVQRNVAQAQLQASRASFAAIVGHNPGNLTPVPALPRLPSSPEIAYGLAEDANPDIAAARAQVKVSQQRIVAARSEGQAELSLRGTAGTTGPAVPLERTDQDVVFAGRAVLTVPLFTGGRVRSLVAQARNRETADSYRVTAIRRRVARALAGAWNQWVTSDRNRQAQALQLGAAQTLYEGTLAEYREGLRSTFDVLYAQNSLGEAEISLLASERDQYVAKAAVLRQMGLLEAGKLLASGPSYDPDDYRAEAISRVEMPWTSAFHAMDELSEPPARPQVAQELPFAGRAEMEDGTAAESAQGLVTELPLDPASSSATAVSAREAP